MSADAIAPLARPARAQTLEQATLDPAYGTRIYRATDASEGSSGSTFVRHAYSRKQAFNADSTRYLVRDSKSYWHLYDAQTLQKIRQLPKLLGEADPIWHPTDPGKLYMTSNNGGSSWWLYDVNTDATETVFDFTLPATGSPWPQATQYWTHNEGTASADGRYLALMVSSYDSATRQTTMHGLMTVDLAARKIIGTLPASRFPKPGTAPDHVSISPSGKYVVPSWPAENSGDTGAGTYAYARDFSGTPKRLHTTSEHSDLAYGPARQDYYVFADYQAGRIRAVDMDTLQSIDIEALYPQPGESYALHISGQAFDKPGWVVISTYQDYSGYDQTRPAAELRAPMRKVWLAELKAGGRKLNVTHTRLARYPVPYFFEPQASASRDLSRIIFTSDFGAGGNADDYIAGLPSWLGR